MDSIFDALLARSLTGGGGGGGGGTTNYNSLENKPQINGTTLTGNKSLSDLGIAEATDIPTVNNGTLTIQKNGTAVNTFKANQSSDVTVNITVPTTAADVSALPSNTKYAAALSLTINSSTYVVTGQLKDQDNNNLGNAQTIDLPLETMVVGGSYDDEHKKIVLTLKNGNTVDIPVADLVSGLQTELSATNKLNPAYIDYDSTHAAVTEAEKTSWSGKQDTTLTGYTVDTAEASITASSTVTDGIEQLDYRSARDKSALVELVDGGAKNVLKFDALSRASHNGVDFTYNSDGSITVNTATSATDNAYAYLNLDGSNVNVKAFCDGNYVISGCPTNSQGVTLRVMGTEYTTTTDSGSGAVINEYTGENVIRVAVYVAKNSAVTNLKIKPMICSKAAWDISTTYQPYRPSYQELYEMVLALQA